MSKNGQKMYPTKQGGDRVAPKTASPGAGACDGGGSAELAKAASSINRPKSGGAKAN